MDENDYKDYYALAKRLIEVENKTEAEAAAILVSEGIDRDKAERIVVFASGRENGSDVLGAYDESRDRGRSEARKKIIFGALWCIGGTIGTMADIGVIFWGAILFGGLQVVNGLIKLGNS